MAINLSDNIHVSAPKPVDSRYLDITNVYTSVGQVNSCIPSGERYVGLTVNINDIEYWYSTGIGDGNLVIKTAGGTLTGAINGLHLINSGTTVALGGNLITGTTINGLGLHSLTLLNISDFQITPSGTSSVIFGIDNTGLFFSFTGGSVSFDDNGGLKYGGDYATNYTDRSLVDKAYVNAVAIGLQPKTAVWVATTGSSIILSGVPKIIDGISVIAGQRVLVKNQSGLTANKDNGIYVAASGAWTRATDFDGSPQGEIAQGALIPVLSGNTLRNTLWVLITPDPITGGTTPLSFTQFSTPGYAAGTGINISGITISTDSLTQSIVNLAITGTTNGLTKTGRNVGLGGNLTGNTDIYMVANSHLNLGWCAAVGGGANGSRIIICNGSVDPNKYVNISSKANFTCSEINVATTGITINSTAGGFQGAVYGGDYSANYSCLSLINAGYVTGFTSCGITTADNGLTKSGQNVSLGGILTGDTTIDITASWNLAMTSANIGINICGVDGSVILGDCTCTAEYLKLGGGLFVDTKTDDTSIVTTSGGGICVSNTNDCVSIHTTGGAYVCVTNTCVDINGNGGAMTVIDGGATKGLVYGGAYEPNFTCLSLVTANYVTGLTSCAIAIAPEAITGATNGLCKYDCHNACLGGDLTCDVTINLNGHIFNICGAIGSDFINLNDCSTSACFGTNCPSTTELRNDCYSLTLSSAAYFHDCTCIGLCYDGDYEANFVARSLVTKQYVLGQITGGTGLYDATNGLNKNSGNCIGLGGTLTGNTIISSGSFDLGINVINLNLTGSTSLNLNSTTINLTGTTINLTGAIKLKSTPASGSISDAVLVWNSGDTCVKQYPLTSLSNIVNVCNVGGGSLYYALLCDHFIGACSGSTIVLPTNPNCGQRLVVSDISGCALVCGIKILCSNSHPIVGFNCATINTDYGSISFIYNGNFWSTVAFIN